MPPVPDAVRDYLAQLARDERESLGRQARGHRGLRALARRAGARADAVALRLARRTAICGARRSRKSARNEDQQAAAAFLIRVATQDSDTEARKTAVARLGEIAGEQALGTLRQTATSNDADTELQKQAVSAIARRPTAESVPLLINIARTHAKPEIRKHAFVLLGRTGDPAAVEFLRSVLMK